MKASDIIRLCYDRELERKWASKYASRGYPPLEVVWDIPQTLENLKLVNGFVHDYSGNPFVQNFLRKEREEE